MVFLSYFCVGIPNRDPLKCQATLLNHPGITIYTKFQSDIPRYYSNLVSMKITSTEFSATTLEKKNII